MPDPTVMPSSVTPHLGVFDRFADGAAKVASRAPFFAFCVLLVVIWIPSYFLFSDADTWQLVINTGTTIITFLMVALLQNSQFRSDLALQHKLNAIAEALAEFMETEGTLDVDVDELRAAVGIEQRESST